MDPLMARTRSTQASLGQIVLGFELVIVFLAALTIFGLKALPPVVALGGGAVVCLLMLATVGLMTRFRWAFTLGYVIQGIIVLSGFAVTMMFLLGAVFTGLYTYAMITGARLDSQKGTP
jgi:membrane protein YdbS with pleckstrin-like domain